MKIISLTLTLIGCYNVFIGTYLTGVLCTNVKESSRNNEYNDQVRWKEDNDNIWLKHENTFDNRFIKINDKEVYHSSTHSGQKRFSKQIFDEPQSQDHSFYYPLSKQQHLQLKSPGHQKQHRHRHNHKRNQKNMKHNRSGFKINDNVDFRNNNEFGYDVDTNNQRFIRQAARKSTQNNAAFAIPNATNANFNNPILSTSLILPSSTQLNYTWPLKRSVDLEGDILLGGLHMVHERNVANVCGIIMGQGGVQAVETMLHAIDYVNNEMTVRGEWIKNVTLGAHILDDCDTDTYGLEMAVDFIKGNDNSIH